MMQIMLVVSESKRKATNFQTLLSSLMLVSAGPVHATKKRPKTEQDWWLRLHAFQTTQLDRFKPIATGVAQVIPLKNLHI